MFDMWKKRFSVGMILLAIIVIYVDVYYGGYTILKEAFLNPTRVSVGYAIIFLLPSIVAIIALITLFIRCKINSTTKLHIILGISLFVTIISVFGWASFARHMIISTPVDGVSSSASLGSNIGTLGDSFALLNTLFSGFAVAGLIWTLANQEKNNK